MIVVISNKLKKVIEESRLKDADCKYTVGYFSVDDYIRNLDGYKMDYLIIDITAIKDSFESSTWKKFRDFFDPERTVILLDESKSYSDVEFLAMLVIMGFYNFTKTGEGVLRLMQYPNSYRDVSKYQQMAMVLEERKEREEEQVSDYQRQIEEKQEMMRDYREKYQNGEAFPKKKDDTLKFQLQTGLLVLPILTFVCTFVIYSMQIIVSQFVPATGDYVGEYLYGELAHTGFTPITIIGILLCMLIFALYYTFLNSKIKKRQMTRSKFMVIPFALYCVVIFGEYYFIGIFENLYKLFMFIDISDKPYLCQDLYDLSRWVATAAIVLYYASTFVNNSRTVKFEKDLGQKLTILEKFWVVDLLFILIVPLSYRLSRVLPTSNSIYQFFNMLYDQPLAMMLIVGLDFILLVTLLLQPKFAKEKEYTILKEEDL